MKNKLSIIILCCFILLSGFVNAQNKKGSKEVSQKALFDQFFELNEGDTSESKLKIELMTKIFKMDSSTRYGAYMPAFAATVKQESLDPTIVYIEKLIVKYPDFAEAYFLYGQALYFAGKDGYIEQIQKCIEMNPNLSQPFFVLATIYSEQKNNKVALLYYDKLEKVNPKHKSLYYNRAYLKGELNDVPGAIADYTKCIETQPGHIRAIFNRGKCYLSSRNFIKAEEDFTNFIKLYPAYGPAYYNLAVARYYLDKKSEACSDAEKGKAIGDKSCADYIEKYCN